MLATAWEQRQAAYDFVVIGSGYGGAITAARLAGAKLQPKPSVCILERGREWQPGEYPESLAEVIGATRGDLNPLGLYELLNYPDISVIKGSGLGGTSLINANVAIQPEREVFEQGQWPAGINYDALAPYYRRASQVLAAGPHPHAAALGKVQALDRRARELGGAAQALNIAVNFTIDGANPYGVQQKPCVDCGNCVTGCNVGAKNTLYMNYLPMAQAAGVSIFTQTKVEWLEKLGDGGWRIHGRRVRGAGASDSFTLDAREVVLAAGALNSTEILLRSEMRGLSVSPALGTRFSGNGDFFGLAYNGDFETDVLGFAPGRPPGAGDAPAPGPNIVGLVRYGEGQIAIEDFSFPSAYVDAAKVLFAGLRGEDTVTGNEDAQRARLLRDLDPAGPARALDGALNHSMLYLVMGLENARGVILFEAPVTEPDGRIRVSWDQAGQQQIFTRMNEELRRHARALDANFISNPTWSVFNLRHLVTAHPLGGCPMGDDHLQGAVDVYGRVFSGDGSVHRGLYVADGSILPNAIGVNPFLTISAVTERFAERKVRELGGEAYPAPPRPVSMATIDALEVIAYNEGQLEALFRRSPTLPIDALVNQGGEPAIDSAGRTIRNDRYWKGFFPHGHVLNAMSSALFTGFRKEFHKQGAGYTGITSDTDGRIQARNSLEEIVVDHRSGGTLEPGRYILLRYVDPPWQGFYDIFKIVNQDLLIGRVYLGVFPHGVRQFTFSMSRRYGFDHMTVADHAALFASAAVPTAEDMQGVWRMDAISNANQAGAVAHLQFENLPGGRLQARYQMMGLFEGLVVPSAWKDHFHLDDFTFFHDEIRKVTGGLMVGKYVAPLPVAPSADASLGLFHAEQEGRFGLYYTLTRVTAKELPTNLLLRPYLDAALPDGIGMTFDEEMIGQYFPGEIELPRDTTGGVGCGFQARITVRDLNEFIEGGEHEAGIGGSIHFDRFEGAGPASFAIDESGSRFNYLRANEATGVAEMRYRLAFRGEGGRRFVLEGFKYLRRDSNTAIATIGELMEDYTTLYAGVSELLPDGTVRQMGSARLQFRIAEELAPFLASFRINGTSDPMLQVRARLRFLAFTAQFVQREYDPLSFGPVQFSGDVRAEVARGADRPDFFSTRPASELRAILKATSGLPIEKLVNTGAVRVDYEQRRIFRDCFWKGSFAADTLLGWEERLRTAVLSPEATTAGRVFAGGSFWKRFDRVEGGVAAGYVVNYEIAALPGLPVVREVDSAEFGRVLLLTYANEPYRMVYDTIKIIDEQNAIGVMHLGTYPNGIEFAPFVMARHNYPFENMSVEDHEAMFTAARATVPSAEELQGQWEGHLVFLTRPDASLLNQVSPVLFRVEFDAAGGKLAAHCRSGSEAESVRAPDASAELRLIDYGTLLGKWEGVRFVLKHAQAGATLAGGGA